ncbi:hypothetical protein GCM10027275_38310 [Rhabdobacter roseus]|uniref:DUF3575 domain-containing protein n=1 Tax=Rhabdobacter roseus TaxID=1655419 RepID=A0A840TPQ5_9BACT|nr:DUF3575 domain-containing protein [Rhabdobacter roseus]MBB5285761.1 hypothetical protein [Rhabdobacter roseus]
MKYLFSIFFVLLLGQPGRAQGSADTLAPGVILKLTPLALFDLDNTIQLGAEVPFGSRRFSFQQELGYGHNAFNFWQSEREEYPNRETWRFRSQLRHYFRKRAPLGGYVAVEYLLKKNSQLDWRSVGRDCSENGGCAYFENRQVHLVRYVNAFHLKFGGQWKLGSRTTLDFYLGGGLRSLNVKRLGIDELVLRRDFLPIRTNTPGRYGPNPSASLGIHLGYLLGAARPRPARYLE